MITATTRVSDALAEAPHLRELLPAFHPAFARLNNPVLRRVLPRLVTVAEAAKVVGVDVDALVALMNLPPGRAPGVLAPVARVSEPAPDWYAAARETVLDARPVLANGDDPLAAILGALRTLPSGGQLTVLAPFLPAPLVGLLARQGWSAWTRWDGETCHVTFAHGRSVSEGVSPPEVSAVHGEEGWALDVRGLAPPEPMRAVLAAVDSGQLPLTSRHDREPALLMPHLHERGLVVESRPGEAEVVLHVRRA